MLENATLWKKHWKLRLSQFQEYPYPSRVFVRHLSRVPTVGVFVIECLPGMGYFSWLNFIFSRACVQLRSQVLSPTGRREPWERGWPVWRKICGIIFVHVNTSLSKKDLIIQNFGFLACRQTLFSSSFRKSTMLQTWTKVLGDRDAIFVIICNFWVLSVLPFGKYVASSSSHRLKHCWLGKNCWFSHYVIKIQFKELSILLSFYFHKVLEQLKTNMCKNITLKGFFVFG